MNSAQCVVVCCNTLTQPGNIRVCEIQSPSIQSIDKPQVNMDISMPDSATFPGLRSSNMERHGCIETDNQLQSKVTDK